MSANCRSDPQPQLVGPNPAPKHFPIAHANPFADTVADSSPDHLAQHVANAGPHNLADRNPDHTRSDYITDQPPDAVTIMLRPRRRGDRGSKQLPRRPRG